MPDRGYKINEPMEERFWRKVDIRDDESCWEWTASRRTTGYGQFADRLPGGVKRVRPAHRVSYELTKGAIPDGLLIMHECDNRGCVNPSHLTAGTQSENLIQMVQRNRCPNSKLTPEAVLRVRAMTAAGVSARKLAKQEGVSRAAIRHVISGESWAHVEAGEAA